ncbi:MAG TPA: hypothetical protein VNX26_18145 [Candidatus Acidoferrum sp.]|nr:hypothetical protein [Candidatus Acidoferrum sp.]
MASSFSNVARAQFAGGTTLPYLGSNHPPKTGTPGNNLAAFGKAASGQSRAFLAETAAKG